MATAAKEPKAHKGKEPQARKGPRNPVLRFLWGTLRLFILLFLGYFALCTALLVVYRFVQPPFSTVHLQRWVENWGNEAYDWRYTPVGLDRISDQLERAAVAAEDARFWQHNGFDWVEIDAAREEFERTGDLRGASTISMQLARNLFLTTHRSAVRKVLEIPLTFLVELILPKERILNLYLNVAEWGPDGIFGAQEGAEHHYGIPASRLTRNQAARMAAILPDPQDRRPQAMDRYSRTILTRMWQMGY